MYIKKIILIVSLLITIGLGLFSYKVYNALFQPNTDFDANTEEVFIPTNTSFKELLNILNPYLKNDDTFKEVAIQKKYSNNIKAGRYILKKGMNNNQIISTLRVGNQPVKLSFNNQERIENLSGRIAQQIEADSLSILNSFYDENFLKENNLKKENVISICIPNTYEFFWNTSADAFRNRMLKEYKKFWNEERLQKAEKQNLTPLQVSVLASIVQKETVKVDERPTVAGVYLNRLKKNMLLQADPTVIFAIKHHTQNYDTIIKRVLYKDLEINSLYNTYMYEGLPPAPIFMPDISSIEAVLNPKNHDYLFFVADTKNMGYHLFARTLSEHNQNKNQYIEWINKQKILR